MAEAIQEREQRLIRSEQLATVGRMAAQIAHEVRNPLASIGLNAELLGDELVERGDEPRKRLVASIISEVDRLTEITETYLRFARLPRPKLERENLGAIVASVVEMARGELAQAGVAVSVDIAPGLPEVAADEAQLRQALINLVRNAREAMSGRGARRGSGWRSPCASSRGAASRCACHDSGAGHRRAEHRQDLRPVLLDEGEGDRAGAGAGAADRRRPRRSDRSVASPPGAARRSR